mmetsp:Transcript_34053/g.25137  ORF Transcript_34053/g.25137 Transcript_34053/m.25137 type:complete len:95 (+) Transcript_34053:629-913(+)
MRVPCDCILLQQRDLVVDEAVYYEGRGTEHQKSISTGSISDNNHKEHPDPFLLCDTLVVKGEGRAIVCAVGENCRIFSQNGAHTSEKNNELSET